MNNAQRTQAETKLASIAADNLFIDTLETRNSDSLDFHDVAVWQLKEALMAAYEAGMQAGRTKAN
jgi:hypothetical protein